MHIRSAHHRLVHNLSQRSYYLKFPVAPRGVKYEGAFYISGNSVPLYIAADILGPYERYGPLEGREGPAVEGCNERHGLAERIRCRHLRRRRW